MSTFTFTTRETYKQYVAEYKARCLSVEERIRDCKRLMRVAPQPAQGAAQSRREALKIEATKLYAERRASKVEAGAQMLRQPTTMASSTSASAMASADVSIGLRLAAPTMPLMNPPPSPPSSSE